MIGIPAVDAYTTRIEDAQEEAELRNIGREVGRDKTLTSGQMIALNARVSRKIEALKLSTTMEHYGKDGLTITTGKGEGGVALSAAEPPQEQQIVAGVRTGSAPLAPQSAMTAAEMGRRIAAWNELAVAIEQSTKGAVKLIKVRGAEVPYRTATFWRAMRLAHNLEVRTVAEGSSPEGAHAEVEVSFPSGKGVMRSAKALRTEKGKEEVPEDFLGALAWTRAVNRATRELVGLGETEMSAEEVE